MIIEEIMIRYMLEQGNQKDTVLKLEGNIQEALDKILKKYPNMEDLLNKEEKEIFDYFEEVPITAVLQKNFIERLIDNTTDVMALMIDYHASNKNVVDSIINDYEEVVVSLLYLQLKKTLNRSKMTRDLIDSLDLATSYEEDTEENVNIQ